MLTLSNDNLLIAVRSLVKEERRLTRNVLDHINEVERRRLYANLGFSSVFEWLVKDLGYSESAAYRRLQAARLLRAVPAVAAKIESGELALTVLSKVQTLIRQDEKRTGERMSSDEKSEILQKVESCSGHEVEQRLATRFPDAVETKEKMRAVGDDQISMQLTFTRAQFEKLKRIREVLSHTHLESSHANLLDAAMDAFLEKNDPLMRMVKPRLAHSDTAAKSTPQPATVKPSVRNDVFKKSGGQCEYRSAENDRRCESRHLLEIDHVVPRARGGTNSHENLRVLCRTHNLLAAEQVFGTAEIAKFRRPI